MVTRRRAALAVVAVLLVAVLAGSLLIVRFGHKPIDQRPSPVAKQPAQIISPEAYTPAAPSATGSPVSHDGLRVKVPELAIDLPIVEGDGYNAPLYKAAHYPGTTWPGEGGRSVIYAHARPGMFEPLFQAKVGERVEFAGPDGSSRRYVIQQYFARWPVTDLRWLRPTNHEEVVLITCTTYNYNDPRIIVVAEQA